MAKPYSSFIANCLIADDDVAFDDKENDTNSFNDAGPSDTAVSPNFEIGRKSSFVDPSQYPDDPNMPALEDIIYSDDEEDVGVEADFSNLKTSITVSPIPTTRVHKDHPVNQIIGDLSSAPQTRSMTRMVKEKVYQMDVKSAFLYETIEEEVYVCQPPGFKDPDYPDKVYKVVKALYGLHQAPKACPDKYVAGILRNFGLTDGKLASTPINTEKPLLKDPNGEDMDIHIYRSMIGSLMYLTLSEPDIMFAICACAHFQVTPKVSHLHAVKRIFRYLKGKPHLGLWYPKDSFFNLGAYFDSDYAGASLNRKSTTGEKVGAVRPKLVLLVLIEAQHHISNESPLLGVNTPRCDEDCLALMKLMVFLYALILNPTIYVSCIKQFWTSVLIKKSNDVMRLQAPIDRKKVIITENTIRQALRLNDTAGVDCLPNEEIFVELARMGYEKPSTKLTFYKQFWTSVLIKKSNDVMRLQAPIDRKKVIITENTIRQALRLNDAAGVDCLPNEEIFVELARMGYEKPSTKLTFYKVENSIFQIYFDNMVRNVDSPSKFLMYPRFLQLMINAQVDDLSSYNTKYTSSALTQKVFANMRRIGKGFSGVDTPYIRKFFS
nr:hypothetical protein [Tanacetum cinerariifolium]